jgi:hypothetical protein
MHAHQLFSGWDDGIGAEPFGGDVLRDFRNVAIHAVTEAHHQRPSIAYGYARVGPRQKVLLFGSIDQGRAWYDQREHLEPGHDYAAVFDAAILHAPILEDVGAAVAGGHDPQVGHWLLPLALGLPAGALGGYYYRKWQESHPGKIIPWISGDPSVGAAPWYSIEDPGGPHFLQKGPWVDVVGAEVDDVARRRAWPQTRALIHSAIREVLASAHAAYGEPAFVWSLDAYGVAHVAPFPSYGQALEHHRDLTHQGGYAALAVFDRTNPHWPNPVGWNKSDDPAYEYAIAQQIARHPRGGARAAGEIVGASPWHEIVGASPWHEIVGASPWHTIVGQDLGVLRQQAKAAAEGWIGIKRSEGRPFARVLGILLDGKSARPRFMAFRSEDLAEEWFEKVTGDPDRFAYAAYYDTQAPFAPVQLAENVGGRGHKYL